MCQFQDCKVLVSNVDSQPSLQGGVIVLVLGEMSNKGETCHKFTQTFFLAEQPEGYYVLNDMFRFLKEDFATDVVEETPVVPNIEKAEHVKPLAIKKSFTAYISTVQKETGSAEPQKQKKEVAKPAPVAAPVQAPSPVPAPELVEEVKAAPAPKAVTPAPVSKPAVAPVAAPATVQPKSWAALINVSPAPSTSQPAATTSKPASASPKKDLLKPADQPDASDFKPVQNRRETRQEPRRGSETGNLSSQQTRKSTLSTSRASTTHSTAKRLLQFSVLQVRCDTLRLWHSVIWRL
jgi:Nuclear transport factor 2 (NTF2) domain